jgi:ankyrin repeat protein
MRKIDEELHIACRNDDLASVKRLLEEGADINAQDCNGDTPLHHCAGKGRFYLVEFLIEKGANPSATNMHGYTPYNYAKNCKFPGTTELLKSHIKNNIANKVNDKLNDIEI